jgi:hypothetical protein
VYVFSLSCPARNPQAPYYIFFFGLSGAILNFPHCLIIDTIFERKNVIELKMYVIIFSTTLYELQGDPREPDIF